MERVTITTSDNHDIVGDYYSAQSSVGVLLLHMMPKNKKSWQYFAPILSGKGFKTLAIDLRGHGESSGGPEGYKEFSDDDHQQSIMDLEAGVSFLNNKGVSTNQIVLIGASIGANLALWYAAERSEIRQIVLLSAGDNYRGIIAQNYLNKLGFGQRVFFVSSQDDKSNADQNRKFAASMGTSIDVRLLIYESAGHGTDMFDKEQPDLSQEIVTWIK
jgi:pimeloyl-ACP methyl ester carboxylesterase